MSQLTPSQARLRQQQLEQAAFDVVRRQSASLADQLERLADNVDGLRDNADVVASVLEHWQDCFRATHLAVASLAERKTSTSAAADPTHGRLVRIPVEDK